MIADEKSSKKVKKMSNPEPEIEILSREKEESGKYTPYLTKAPRNAQLSRSSSCMSFLTKDRATIKLGKKKREEKANPDLKLSDEDLTIGRPVGDMIQEALDQVGQGQDEVDAIEVSLKAFELAEEVIEELQFLARY